MIFEVRTIYQKADLEGVSNAYYYTKRPVRFLSKALSWFYVGLGLFWWANSLLFLVVLPRMIKATVADGQFNFSFAAMSVALMIVFFLLGVKSLSKSNMPLATKLSWRFYKQKGEKLFFCFASDRFWMERPNVKSELEYSCIQRLLEDKDRFYLFDSPQTAFILPKRDFQRGDYNEFRDFIFSATGKDVESIK